MTFTRKIPHIMINWNFSSIESPYGFDNINKMNDGRLFVNGHSFEWTGFDFADFHPMAAPFHKLGKF